MNPQGLIPFLIDGQTRIAQSLAIMEYLDEIVPEPAILPKDAEASWLASAPGDACALLKPYEGAVSLRAVGRRVSNPRDDVPECLDDAEPGWGAQRSLL